MPQFSLREVGLFLSDPHQLCFLAFFPSLPLFLILYHVKVAPAGEPLLVLLVQKNTYESKSSSLVGKDPCDLLP